MVKVSMKMTDAEMQKSKAKKSKVKKYYGPNLAKILDAYFDCSEEEQNAIDKALDDFVSGYTFREFMDELIFKTANILDGVSDDDKFFDDEFFKAVKTLKAKGYKVVKDDSIDEDLIVDTEEEDAPEEEETATEEESEETEEVEDESDDDDVEVDVDVETEKSKKSQSLKSAYDLFKKKGWIGKTNDDGIDSQELESEVLDDPVANVPETPEPKETVQQTKTGVPKDAPEPESQTSEDVTEKDGNDLDALEPETENNQDISTTDADDIEALINQKRAEKSKDQVPPASYQPFANNYRTVQRGEGKMPISAVIPNKKQTVGKKRI